MPNLNQDKLQYEKHNYTLSDSLKKTGGFYNNRYGPSPNQIGYHNYDYFGPTPRRHEEENDVKENEDNERWPIFII